MKCDTWCDVKSTSSPQSINLDFGSINKLLGDN